MEDIDCLIKQLITSVTGFQVTAVVFVKHDGTDEATIIT